MFRKPSRHKHIPTRTCFWLHLTPSPLSPFLSPLFANADALTKRVAVSWTVPFQRLTGAGSRALVVAVLVKGHRHARVFG